MSVFSGRYGVCLHCGRQTERGVDLSVAVEGEEAGVASAHPECACDRPDVFVAHLADVAGLKIEPEG